MELLRIVSIRTLKWFLFSILGIVILGILDVIIAQMMLVVLNFIGFDIVIKGLFFNFADYITSPETLLLSFFFVSSIRCLGQFIVSQANTEIVEGTQYRLRNASIKHSLLTNPHKMDDQKDAVYWHGSVVTSASFGLFYIGNACLYLVNAIILFGFMFYIAPRETSVALMGIMAIGASVYATNKIVQKRISKVTNNNVDLSAHIKNITTNLLLIKLSGKENEEWRKTNTTLTNTYDATCNSMKLSHAASSLTPFLGILLLIGILVKSVGQWHTDKNMLLMFFYLFIRFVQGLSSTSTAISSATQFFPHLKDGMLLLTSIDQKPLAPVEMPCTKPVKKLHQHTNGTHQSSPEVSIDKIYHSFDEQRVLENFSTKIPANTCTAIVGPSGSGKSTLLAILLGLLKPDKGEVRYTERILDKPVYMEGISVGYVGPSPFITNGTISENVQYFEEQAGDKIAVQKALKGAGILEDVLAMPDGIDTVIGIGGKELSSGQKQKIGLARILFSRPQLVVLDEATANLDKASEATIIQSLRTVTGASTIVMVTHRTEPLQLANEIIEMNVPCPVQDRYEVPLGSNEE